MRFLKRKLFAGGATLAMALVLAPSALAASHHPTGEYEQFGECPLSIVTVSDCVYSVSNGGAFKMGSKNVPLVNPVILQGGYEGAEEEVQFHGAENGDTLSKTPQPVPGGLTWRDRAEMVAQLAAELVQQPDQRRADRRHRHGRTGAAGDRDRTQHRKPSLPGRHGAGPAGQDQALQLDPGLQLLHRLELEPGPAQIHDRHQRLAGRRSAGELVVQRIVHHHHPERRRARRRHLLGAGGKRLRSHLLSFFIDPLVNSILGLPASSGNTATLEGVLQDAASSAVKASE